MITYSKNGIKDAVSFFSYAPSLRRPMYAMLDKIQEFPPHIFILALSTLLSLTTEELGLDVRDVLASTERITGDMDGAFVVEIEALRAFIKHEYLGTEV